MDDPLKAAIDALTNQHSSLTNTNKSRNNLRVIDRRNRAALDEYNSETAILERPMPWIQNVSYVDVANGTHKDPGPASMLIQIVDPGMDFPLPVYEFGETHQFKFSDIEQPDPTGETKAITDSQAKYLVTLLQHALDNSMNVVVHCVAGICRSGAVAEVGTMIGFRDAGTHRIPNLLVKHKMMKSLGWTYD